MASETHKPTHPPGTLRRISKMVVAWRDNRRFESRAEVALDNAIGTIEDIEALVEPPFKDSVDG